MSGVKNAHGRTFDNFVGWMTPAAVPRLPALLPRSGPTPPDCGALTGALGSGIGPPPWRATNKEARGDDLCSYPQRPRCDREPTVLVVEEDDVARSFLAENLEADRYRVRTADSREKALAILLVQRPDVIVVDVNGKTLDLIDAIRDGDGLAGRVDPDTPLIVLTTRVDELHRIRVLDRGGDDVLAKPYSYPELRARITALLRRARARRAPRMLRVGQLTIDLSARMWRSRRTGSSSRPRSTSCCARSHASRRAC